jgi:hypothetical protein
MSRAAREAALSLPPRDFDPMKKLILAITVSALAATTLPGCVVAHATGQAVVADAAPDNHLRIVVVPADWVDPASHMAILKTVDKHLATLFPALVQRLPQDFKLNGLEASAELLEPGRPIPTSAGARTLVIQPAKAWGRGGMSGTGLDLEVRLIDTSRGVLWQGSIRMSAANPGVWDASAVDHAAVPLLEQLRDAKMIDISWRRPVTP